MAAHHNVLDKTGQRFGRLIALQYAGNRKWLCRCDCGTEKQVRSAALSNGTTVSCGCFHLENSSRVHTKHGMEDSSEYRTWVNMKYRCNNPNAANYDRYGGAGIRVCARWQKDFATFFADMGPKPSRKHSIDRIDGSRGYEPSNCRWATGWQQHRNKRSNRRISFRGKKLTIEEWSHETGFGRETIAQRLHRGWSIRKTLTTPVRTRT